MTDIECAECGHDLAQHDFRGCLFKRIAGCTCPLRFTKSDIRRIIREEEQEEG